ncbi:MAG: hypothetical protein E7680_01240 [Ruminococcaceae bacterium]|nr:hypothetical protein [Oscillospiraceae bacterium]
MLSQRRKRTSSRYSEIVRQHLIPKLGESEMDEITPIVLQHFVTELLQTGNLRTGKGLSANFVSSIINVMQSSLRTAYQLGYTKEYNAIALLTTCGHQKRIALCEADATAKNKRFSRRLFFLWSGYAPRSAERTRKSHNEFRKPLLNIEHLFVCQEKIRNFFRFFSFSYYRLRFGLKAATYRCGSVLKNSSKFHF